MRTIEITKDHLDIFHVKLSDSLTVVANTPDEISQAIDHYIFGHKHNGGKFTNACPLCRHYNKQKEESVLP